MLTIAIDLSNDPDTIYLQSCVIVTARIESSARNLSLGAGVHRSYHAEFARSYRLALCSRNPTKRMFDQQIQ